MGVSEALLAPNPTLGADPGGPWERNTSTRRPLNVGVLPRPSLQGVGVSEALLRYHALSTTRQPVPFTNVRTLSNWLVPPLVQTSPGVWQVRTGA